MAFRELHVVDVKEILRLWALGRGHRCVADRTGTDRKTVRRYVEAAREAGFDRNGKRPLDDELIAEVVTALQPGAPSTPPRGQCVNRHYRGAAPVPYTQPRTQE